MAQIVTFQNAHDLNNEDLTFKREKLKTSFMHEHTKMCQLING
jgi:hypothetical protein